MPVLLNPTENVYVVPTSGDLPDELSRFVVYHLLYDPGDGVGLYYSPDESTLTKIGSGGSEVNDLTAAVTWANVPDANITESSVTQHEAALTIVESQITNAAFTEWDTSYSWGDHSISEINTQNGDYTLVLADAGKTIYKASGIDGETITIPANGSVAFPIGSWVTFDNDGGGVLSIAITTDTLVGTDGVEGTRSLGDNHRGNIQKLTSTRWRYTATDL